MFVCSNCGYESAKWLGKCPSCSAWNSFKELKTKLKKADREFLETSLKPQNLIPKEFRRYSTGISEIDRVLGGGIVEGSVILLGGDPGVGKSTLALQIASAFNSLYVSGEENIYQVSERGRRLNALEKISFLSTNSLSQALEEAKNKSPKLLIIDSLQTLVDEETEGEAGSISQVKAVTLKLLNLAKRYRIMVILIGHVTKTGIVAGPKTVEHMVDVVLYLEGERYGFYRLLRSVKNRFGSVSEIGVFEMTSKGLVEVKNPSEIFLNFTKSSGSVQTCILEGTRPLFVTIEVLVTKTFSQYPKRTSIGFDLNRALLILAVLEKRLKLKFFNKDVFIKVSGGLTIKEPTGDLALGVALISSLKEKAIDPYSVFLGELSLSGELKEVVGQKIRLKEAQKLGFKKVFIPKTKKPFISEKIKIVQLSNIKEVYNLLFKAR